MNRKVSCISGKGCVAILLSGLLLGSTLSAHAYQTIKPKPAVKPGAPAKTAAKPPGGATGTRAHPAATVAQPGKEPTANGIPTTASKDPTANGGQQKTPSPVQKLTANPTTSKVQPTQPGKAGSPTPVGGETKTASNGAKVTTRSNGEVSDIRDAKRDMDIHHGLDGSRRVSVNRKDGSRLVAERGRPGYVQRGYQYHGHDFARRSYYYQGREYESYYRGYAYGGVTLDVYAPGSYFAPGFYGWAYNPWVAPISYGWGWGAIPWVGFYGGFFTPWAVYPSAAFWLTDYMIATDLQAAYAARVGNVQGGVAVMAAQPWTDTSTQLAQGQTYSITASGIINYSGGNPSTVSTPVGIAGGTARDPADSAPSLPSMGLIGKVGPDGAPFYVGNSTTFAAPTGGELFLGVNDSYFPDNGGGWVATISQPSASDGSGAVQQAGGSPALTPEVKQLIADEVKNQLALENAEAAQTALNQDVDAGSSGIARLLGDGHPHMFVVGVGLDVTDATSGQECHVSDGDALQLLTPPTQGATAANLVVKASKGGVECAPASTVAVSLTDLQEMQNHMRENIDVGLKELQGKQGTGGLPQAPPSAQAAPVQPQYAAIAPPPNPQDSADIQAQTKQADQAESEAQGMKTSVLHQP